MIRDDPDRWAAWVRSYHVANLTATDEEAFWALYKDIVRLGAAALIPLCDATGYRYGHMSAQVDPRYSFDTDAILRQALELAVLSPNTMIKVPGTREGMPVLRELTRRGISTNCTLAGAAHLPAARVSQQDAHVLSADGSRGRRSARLLAS